MEKGSVTIFQENSTSKFAHSILKFFNGRTLTQEDHKNIDTLLYELQLGRLDTTVPIVFKD
jgi:hypothetical protein